MAIAFYFFSQYWHFIKFSILLIYRFPTLLSTTKEGFKALWTWCLTSYFPCISGAARVTQPGTPRPQIHNRGPKYRTYSCVYDILNSFADTQSEQWNCHVLYGSYTNNRTCQIAYKYIGIKICYKIDRFAFGGEKSKVVHRTVLT